MQIGPVVYGSWEKIQSVLPYWPLAAVVAAIGGALLLRKATPQRVSPPPLLLPHPPEEDVSLPPFRQTFVQRAYRKFSSEPYREKTPAMEADIYELLDFVRERNLYAVEFFLDQFAADFPANAGAVAQGVRDLALRFNEEVQHRSWKLQEIQEIASRYLTQTPTFLPSPPKRPIDSSTQPSLWKVAFLGWLFLSLGLRFPPEEKPIPALPLPLALPAPPPKFAFIPLKALPAPPQKIPERGLSFALLLPFAFSLLTLAMFRKRRREETKKEELSPPPSPVPTRSPSPPVLRRIHGARARHSGIWRGRLRQLK